MCGVAKVVVGGWENKVPKLFMVVMVEGGCFVGGGRGWGFASGGGAVVGGGKAERVSSRGKIKGCRG